MPRHSFVRHIKLGDVKGRIDYIQNPKRQEHLYAAYDTAPETFWPLLAKQNRFDHRRSGTRGDCIEARELMIALPEALQEKDPDGLLKLFTDAFKEKYGVECVSALHHNKAMTNYHIHLIYSERKLKDRGTETSVPDVISCQREWSTNTAVSSRKRSCSNRDPLRTKPEAFSPVSSMSWCRKKTSLPSFPAADPSLPRRRSGRTTRRKRRSERATRCARNGTRPSAVL